MSGMEIWVDKKTGMHYLYHAGGYAGGRHGFESRQPKFATDNNRYERGGEE